MSWRLAESLKTLRTQINALYPNRDKTSDGSIGDTSHSARKSDHNPNGKNVVTAIDIDRELDGQPEGAAGATVATIVGRLQDSRDPRIKYIIWNGHITVQGNIAQWKPYHGVNAHKHHAHISVSSDPKLYDDPRPWDLSGTGTHPTVKESLTVRDLKIGDEGEDVKQLQKALKVTVDGEFGRGTRKAVIDFQHDAGLRPDGIVGKQTRHELGI